MRAELLKMRVLRTPRIMFGLALSGIALAALITYLVEPGDTTFYWKAPSYTATYTLEFVAIVIGVWLIAMEFSGGTVRRVLTAEPRRSRVVLNKLVVVAGTVLVMAAIGALVAFWLGALAADLRDVDYDQASAAKLAVVAVVTAVLASLISFALGLVAENLAGGLVLAFAVLFVLDGVVSFVSAIRDYTFGSAVASIANRFDPTQSAALSLGIAILVALAWVAVITAVGVYRFTRTDFK